MDPRTVLAKLINLVFRTRLLGIFDHDDFVMNIINKLDIDQKFSSNKHMDYIRELKDYIIELLQEHEPIEYNVVAQRLSIMLEKDQTLLKTILDFIQNEKEESTNKRIITNLLKALNNYYKEVEILEVFNSASYDLKFNRGKIGNVMDYVRDVILRLEPIVSSAGSKIKDPAVVNEIDFDNKTDLKETFEEFKRLNSSKSILKTGWQDINVMTQGGLRQGEFVTVGALQHKYKTGFTLSLFMQIVRHNTPVLKDPNKKPLIIRISFEDSLVANLQFMYTYLKAHEYRDLYGIEETGKRIRKLNKSIQDMDTGEISEYVIEHLTKTGFNIKLMRVDPSQWSYVNVINKILELEANGYEIKLLMLDYITLLPTKGCNTTGGTGTDKRDLIRRIRNFCSAKDITVVTPLQLSSEAKQLIRNGIPEHTFVKEVAEKGYYDGCKSLDQDIDLELFIHLFGPSKGKLLSVARGKHRVPTIIDDDDKYILLPFPDLGVPILEDINLDTPIGLKKLPKRNTSVDDDSVKEIFG